MSPLMDRQHDGRHLALGPGLRRRRRRRAAAPRRSGRTRRRAGRACSTGRSRRCRNRCWQARAERPAGGRSRSAATATRGSLRRRGAGWWEGWVQARGGRRRSSQSTMRAMSPFESTAPPERAVRSPSSAGSGRVTSSRWPTSSSTASASRRSPLRTHDGETRPPRRAGSAARAARSIRGRTPSGSTSIRSPTTERTVWSASASVRSTRSSWIAKGMPPASTSSADMIASVSGCGSRRASRRPAPESQQHLAAELADRAAHHIHADATAGDVARRVGGRDAGVEEQLDGLALKCRRRPPPRGAIRPAAAALRDDARGIDPSAVVADADHDVAAGVAGRDLQAWRRARAFAGGEAVARRASRCRGLASFVRGGRSDRGATPRCCGRARCPGQ